MATLNKFEDLKIWQDSRIFNKNLFQVLQDVDDRKFGYLKNHLVLMMAISSMKKLKLLVNLVV